MLPEEAPAEGPPPEGVLPEEALLEGPPLEEAAPEWTPDPMEPPEAFTIEYEAEAPPPVYGLAFDADGNLLEEGIDVDGHVFRVRRS